MTTKRTSDDRPLSIVAVDVLLSLTRGAKHGYAIKREIEDRIGNGFILGSGSLYQAIQRLQRRGFIDEGVVQGVADARRGRVYRIKPAGKASLKAEFARMDRVLRFARANALVDGRS